MRRNHLRIHSGTLIYCSFYRLYCFILCDHGLMTGGGEKAQVLTVQPSKLYRMQIFGSLAGSMSTGVLLLIDVNSMYQPGMDKVAVSKCVSFLTNPE